MPDVIENFVLVFDQNLILNKMIWFKDVYLVIDSMGIEEWRYWKGETPN